VAGRRKTAPLPSKEQLLEFIRESPGRVGKREIARAFQVRGDDRTLLNQMLKELAAEGAIERGHRRSIAPAGALPSVTVIEIAEIDVDGELMARPLNWRGEDAPPRIVMGPERKGAPALAVGDRVLARLTLIDDGQYEARTIKRIAAAPDQVLGIYTMIAGSARILPTDRRQKRDYVVGPGDDGGAQRGELVLAETLPGRHLGLRQARVVERLGEISSPRALSLIAVHRHGIPTVFSDEALAEAEAAEPVAPGERSDLRDIPLITIDPEDARDHDDAVWAEADPDPGNEGGWHLIVAIADVAHYVRPGGGLDQDARTRGNSVYFPDRVVPMLPEALSSGLCSLHAGEDRSVLAVHIWIDADGRKRRHEFVRALMRSAGALTYRQVQAATDGGPDADTEPLLEPVIRPLYWAHAALMRAREARQPLEIVVPERRVVLDETGHVTAIRLREQLGSHRLIEDFMIAANVAAAETLGQRRRPCMYRVHEPPAPEKLEALRDVLASLELRLAKGQVLKPMHFNRILAQVTDTPHARLVNEVVLRSQSQAAYSPRNLGHFGLALGRYAHFTSPIRRYADLLVHRALIGALGLGEGGLEPGADEAFPELGERISDAERRATAAERDAVDRFTAAFLAERVGATFMGHISGVTRFGLFITLAESGADGLVPMSALSDDYYEHDEARHSLVGRGAGRVYRLGDEVEVRLAEADAITGGLRLELLEDRGRAPAAPKREKKAAGKRRRRR
jgi:ribonuclease R